MKIFSGIQPTGTLHIGNYLGAIKQWIDLQKKNSCIFSIVDLHAITTPYSPKEMQKNILSAAMDYLAAGLDSKKCIIFVQSQVKEHAELAWLLETLTPMGELERMTQFKEKGKLTMLLKELQTDINVLIKEMSILTKELSGLVNTLSKKILYRKEQIILLKESQKHLRQEQCLDNKNQVGKNEKLFSLLEKVINLLEEDTREKDVFLREKYSAVITASNALIKDHQKIEEARNKIELGLLAYPVLMAADILLYKADTVPVGEDQQQHVELSRVLAKKFNNKFGKTFPEPKTQLSKFGARIMALNDPSQKMSKSLGPQSYIALIDSPEAIREKIKTAVTDSGKEIKYDKENKAAISNLLTIYRLFSNKPITDIERKYGNKGYAEFKKDLAEVIIKELADFQKKRKRLEKNPKQVEKILADGAKKAQKIATATMKEIKTKMGL